MDTELAWVFIKLMSAFGIAAVLACILFDTEPPDEHL